MAEGARGSISAAGVRKKPNAPLVSSLALRIGGKPDFGPQLACAVQRLIF
ncbi:hypothetical protein [Methylocystis sp. SB2]|jgi:hypothetical protein|nr:hypothetical protein [Methylocystis sp. SB2]ULO25167.1 hypothetical protein LNB28_07215 [Methylocystis sp. SB2]